ncbi:MAG: hypothetical protein ABIF71_03380 [Planctomycetota bacterium]
MRIRRPALLKGCLAALAVVLGLVLLMVTAYYLFFFRNPRPLAAFVPADADLFVALHDPAAAIPRLAGFGEPGVAGELRTITGGWIDRLGLLAGDSVAICRRGDAYGVVANISLTARAALTCAGWVPGVDVTTVPLQGNTLSRVVYDGRTIYFTVRWNILAAAADERLAADMAELLNRRPVITPLGHDPLFTGLTGAPGPASVFFIRADRRRRSHVLDSEIGGLTAGGGTFTVDDAGLRGSFRAAGECPTRPLPACGRLPDAFLTISLPADLGRLWRDRYCYTVQSRKDQYSSLQVALTSDAMDPLIAGCDPRVTLNLVPGRTAAISGAIAALQGTLPADDRLAGLLQTLAERAQALNNERAAHNNAQKVEFSAAATPMQGVTVHHLDLKPLVMDDFRPGFVVRGTTLLIASDHRDLAGALDDPLPPINAGWYLQVDDPGLERVLGFIRLNLANGRRLLGEGPYAQWMDVVNRIGRYAAGIGSITVTDNARPGLQEVNFAITRRKK